MGFRLRLISDSGKRENPIFADSSDVAADGRHPDAECGGRFLRTRSTAPSAMVTDRYGRPTGRLTRPHNRQDCPFSILSKLRSTMPRCAPRGVRCVCCGAPFFPEVLALPIIGHLLDPGSHLKIRSARIHPALGGAQAQRPACAWPVRGAPRCG